MRYIHHATLLMVIALMVMIPIVNADNLTIINMSGIDINNLSLDQMLVNGSVVHNSTLHRINQGDCVEPGDNVDIAGIGWYSGYIFYCGRYFDDYGACDNLTVQGMTEVPAANQTNFFVDPNLFQTKEGWWYFTPSSLNGESSGNDRLFYVADQCENEQKNMMVNNTSINTYAQQLAALKANLTYLPIKNETGVDMILSMGATTVNSAPNASHRWIFNGAGLPTPFMDEPTPADNYTVFTPAETASLSTGRFDVLFVSPGPNNILEEIADPVSHSITSPFTSKQNMMLPPNEKNLIQAINNSIDDSAIVWHVDVQTPLVDIRSVDQYTLPDNGTLVTIAGYTNANPDSNVTIRLDYAELNGYESSKYTWYTQVVDNGGVNSYRSFNDSFVIDLNQLTTGPHSFRVDIPDTGATGTAPIYNRFEPAANYQPEVYLHFLGNNPQLPTPTPIVQYITLPTPTPITVIQTILIPVTPTQESVNAAWWAGMEGVAIVLVILAIVGYLIFSFIRGVQERRKRP